MFGTLMDWIKDIKDKIFCRTCNYKTFVAIGIIHHLKKEHNTKPTKNDLRFLLKYNFITRLFIKMYQIYYTEFCFLASFLNLPNLLNS